MVVQNIGWAAGQEWPVGSTLNKGKTTSGTITGGTSNLTDIVTGGNSQLSVYVDTSGAASSDITVTVLPLVSGAGGATVVGNPITAERFSGPTFATSKVQYNGQYDVFGYDRVRIQVTNTTGGPLTINAISWQLD